MLDLSIYKTQYYEVKITNSETIHLETPKKNQLKTLLSLTKSIKNEILTEEDIDRLYEAALIAFNKNKENRKFSSDELEEFLSLNALYAFFDGYYSWVAENINQKN